MKKILFVFSALFVLITPMALAQGKDADAYIVNRGLEDLQNGKVIEAAAFYRQNLESNPRCGGALLGMAIVYLRSSQYGDALSSVEKSLMYLPRRNRELMSLAYRIRAEINAGLGNKELALTDYKKAIAYTPDDESLYIERAQMYYEMQDYWLADEDYLKVLSLNSGSAVAYCGIARNCHAMKQYEQALENYNYAIKLSDDYVAAYTHRAETFITLKQYGSAIDDVIKAISLEGDNKVFALLDTLEEVAHTELMAKVKVQSIKDPQNYYWSYALGCVYEEDDNYKRAIEYYKESFKKTPLAATAYRVSACYYECSDFQRALEWIDKALSFAERNKANLLRLKSDILYYSGKTEDAISFMGQYIELQPEDSYGYYRRGFYRDNSRDIEGAIEDYSVSILLSPSYAYAYLGRGDMFLLKGNREDAIRDYKKVVNLDTIPGNSSCAQYAFLMLGEKEKAIDFMDRVLKADSTEAGNFYDAACLYSRMGEKDKAIAYLRKAFEKGFRSFNHMENDDDLDPIRLLPEYINLVDEYRKRYYPDIEKSVNTRDGEIGLEI